MPYDFTSPSSKQIDDLYRNCRSAEDVRELAKQQLETSGAISRDRAGDITVNSGEPHIRAVVPSAPADPTNFGRFSRVIYPHLNDRFEIFGDSVGELDVKEARIRSLYGQR